MQANGQLVVFMVSAFWHGFYGGYYLSFFFWFILIHLSTLVYKITLNYPIISITYKKTGILGHILLWLLTSSIFNHIGFYFKVLSCKSSLAVMKSLYFIPNIGLILITLIVQLSGLHLPKK